MKPDEENFLVTLAADRPSQKLGGPFATQFASVLGIHQKRAEFILLKWTRRGWWDYGVSLRGGWLTETGIAEANKRKPS